MHVEFHVFLSGQQVARLEFGPQAMRHQAVDQNAARRLRAVDCGGRRGDARLAAADTVRVDVDEHGKTQRRGILIVFHVHALDLPDGDPVQFDRCARRQPAQRALEEHDEFADFHFRGAHGPLLVRIEQERRVDGGLRGGSSGQGSEGNAALQDGR